MSRQKPDPYKQQLATPTIPQQHRIPPRDPDIYLSTSPWQTMSYPYELAQKSLLLEECFDKHGLLDYLPKYKAKYNPRKLPLRSLEDERASAKFSRRVTCPASNLIALPMTDNKEYFYRNKMEYALYWDNSEHCIRLAFHQRNSHRKIPFTQSSIERPEILAEATRIVDELNAKHAQARDYQSLMIRCDQQGTVASALFEKHKPHPVMPLLKDTLLGQTYTYSPNGFFQINLPVYELALEEIQKHIITDEVLDLYAGVGTIGLSVAPGHRLTLVEVNKSAYTELVKNCEGSANFDFGRIKPSAAGENHRSAIERTSGHNEIFPARNVSKNQSSHFPQPILAKSEEATDFITPNTTVILDPPRAGLNPKLIDTLNSVKPPTIIYLSCNPVTQARDIAALAKNYKITKLQPFNFFPRTPHIENLAILTAK